MAKTIGRLLEVGFGIEETKGTSVNSQNWMDKTDFSFDDKVEITTDDSSFGNIATSQDTEIVKKWAEGDISSQVEANSFGYLLLALFGSVSSAGATTGAYDHTFSVLNSNNHQSLTIHTYHPTDGYVKYALGMINSLTINVEEGNYATFTVNVMSKQGETTTTQTKTYATRRKFLAKNMVVKLADTYSGLSGASATCLKSFEITFTKNLEPDFCAGSVDVDDFINKNLEITGSFTLNYQSSDLKDDTMDGQSKAISFVLQDTTTTIGLSDNPTLDIVLAKTSLTEWSRTLGNDEVITETLSFTGHYSQSDTLFCQAVLTNETATYEAD